MWLLLVFLEQFCSLFWQHTCKPNSHVQVQDMMTRHCRLLQMFIHWIERLETENMFQGAFDIEKLDSRWGGFSLSHLNPILIPLFPDVSWCFLCSHGRVVPRSFGKELLGGNEVGAWNCHIVRAIFQCIFSNSTLQVCRRFWPSFARGGCHCHDFGSHDGHGLVGSFRQAIDAAIRTRPELSQPTNVRESKISVRDVGCEAAAPWPELRDRGIGEGANLTQIELTSQDEGMSANPKEAYA